MDLVEYTVEGSVALIRLDRPPVNALNTALIADIDESIDRASDAAVRAVVITGSRHFAAGADIGRFVDAFESDSEPMASGLASTIRRFEQMAKPTIAAISGYALGGGLELALGADFRYMADDAKVGQPEILLGIIPGAGGTQRLPRLVGYQKAKELNMSGRHVGAGEALEIGLVDKVVPPGELVSTALEDAARWAEGPTLGYAAAKRAMGDGWGRPIDEALAVEREVFNEVFKTADARRGILAFVEKDTATFVGE